MIQPEDWLIALGSAQAVAQLVAKGQPALSPCQECLQSTSLRP
jgi:hypothetical protein